MRETTNSTTTIRLNDFLPKFEYINTKQYYDSVAKYAKTTPIGIMLSGVLSTILQSNPQYQEFQTKFSELFESDASQIKTEFETIGNQVKIYLEKQFPDTNTLYVNYSDIESADYEISEADKKLNKQFYGK